MGKVAAIVNIAYVLAGVALFATGEAPVITPGTDFLGNKMAMAWAGWKFIGCFYMACVHLGMDLHRASAIAMVPYIAFDIFAVMHPEHWTPLAASFIILEAITLCSALSGSLTVGGVINALYTVAGVVLFATGKAPVMNPTFDFFADRFSMAWAGWKFSGCLYFALVNLGMHNGLATAIAMVPYVGFDVFAIANPAHWSPLAYSFIALDGAIGALGLLEWCLETAKKKAA